ncbi:MAG TPA: hypothetical protein VI036_10650 [Propionibacteriaceae bacterium]
MVAAARRLKLSLSQFMRQALLASSAQVERKVKPRSEVPERKSGGMVLIEPREIHHWVDDVCFRCGVDKEDGGDVPCRP